MSAQWPSPLFSDGDFTVAQPVGIPVFSSPIPATTAEYILEQDWVIARSSFSATALNTAHPSAGLSPDYSNFVLVGESPRKDIAGGLVKWTRRYAIAPASWDDFKSLNYNFIGWRGSIAIGAWWNFTVVETTITGRPVRNRRVDCRVRHDYYLVGGSSAPAAWNNGTTYTIGQTVYYGGSVYVAILGGSGNQPDSSPTYWTKTYLYATAGDIPIIPALHYTAPALATQPIDTDFIFDAFGALAATTPSRTTYEGYMANVATYGWNSGIAPSGTNPGQLIAEDSVLTRWEGNIWHRESYYVLAQ